MEFGKVSDISNIDYTLPEDHPRTTKLLSQYPKTECPEVYFACPAWNDKDFVGKIYPPKTKQADYLYHYSRSFNSIELNTTFYRVNLDSIVKWKSKVPPGFKFCPKVTRQISHYRQLNNVDLLVDEFVDAIVRFEENLGPVFLLLPQNFTPSRLNLVENFITKFPKGIELAVELRHPQWYADPSVVNEVFDMFEENDVISIITDVSGRRDVLHQRVTSSSVIIRFVGNHLHATDFSRMDDWVVRLKEWIDQGLSTAYFFLHQPEEYLNTDLAIYFVDQVKKRYGWELQGPKLLSPDSKQQSLSLF